MTRITRMRRAFSLACAGGAFYAALSASGCVVGEAPVTVVFRTAHQFLSVESLVIEAIATDDPDTVCKQLLAGLPHQGASMVRRLNIDPCDFDAGVAIGTVKGEHAVLFVQGTDAADAVVLHGCVSAAIADGAEAIEIPLDGTAQYDPNAGTACATPAARCDETC